jgi:hypothetical protein
MRFRLLVVTFLLASATAVAQEQEQGQEPEPFETESVHFRISAELKAHYRWSEEDSFPLRFPFPPEFVPVGRDRVALETVASGSSLEVSTATLFLDVDLPRSIAARVKIDFIDLYDRNPTSTDQTVDVDEAWIRFGTRYEPMEAVPGSGVYALFGKAPKFERQNLRRLESYGLASTAFNRFEDIQLQLGGSLGTHVYFRAQISNGNPTFFRDPNALAGDNGTEMPPNPDPKLWSGFPIFYHAEVEELEIDDRPEYGVGAGLRFLSLNQEKGLDLLGFYYRTRLSEAAKLRGTFYEGDLDILDGVTPIPGRESEFQLPIEGDVREEYGLNVDAQVDALSLFFQLVHEEAASLPRDGIEVEAAYRFVIGDPADPSDLFPLIQPAIRYSRLDNDFTAPPLFVVPSVMWDWEKWDIGVRVIIVSRVDLTLEYARHDIHAARAIAHDEFLTTLRLRF